MLSIRRVLLLALCALLFAGTFAAYLMAYRAQVLAVYIQRKTQGVQEAVEVEPELDSAYDARVLAASPSSAVTGTASADSVRVQAARRVVIASFDRADMLDRLATGLTIVLAFAIVVTMTRWKSIGPARDHSEAMAAARARSARARTSRPHT